MTTNFGDNLRIARLNNGFTQKALADKLSYEGGDTISKWESGSGNSKIELLAEISKVLDVSIDELVKGNILLKDEIANKTIPQVKLNQILYSRELPLCELHMENYVGWYYDYYSNDEEATFMQCLLDFGGAYNLDLVFSNSGNKAIYDKIEALYKSAYANGEGIIEAGINLVRFLLMRYIEKERKGDTDLDNYEILMLVKDLVEHDLYYLYEEIIGFYRAAIQVYGIFCGSGECYENKTSQKKDVKESVRSGYEEMIVLADKEDNLYAKSFMAGIKSNLSELAAKKVEGITAFEYWNNGHPELDEEDKAWLEYLNAVSEIFDEIE